MTTITTQSSWQQLFSNVDGLAAVHDADGKLLGYFAPAANPDAVAYARLAARIDPEEMRRRSEYDGNWLTTTEVLEHIKSLGK